MCGTFFPISKQCGVKLIVFRSCCELKMIMTQVLLKCVWCYVGSEIVIYRTCSFCNQDFSNYYADDKFNGHTVHEFSYHSLQYVIDEVGGGDK